MKRILKKWIKERVDGGHVTEDSLCDLARARCGERLRVVEVKDHDYHGARLREIGFCESAVVCKVADRGACICLLTGTRVALARDLAERVVVERIGS